MPQTSWSSTQYPAATWSSSEPSAPTDGFGSAIVWIARATGTFVGLRGPDPDPYVADSGYLLISDETGEIVGMGMP